MKPTTSTILKSGWGIFLAVAGVASVVLDVATHGAGSFTLGWLGIAVVMVAPASAARSSGFAPIHKGLGVLWCIVAFFGWIIIHALGADTGHSPRANLAVVAGLVLCWRLLTQTDKPEPTISPDDDRFYYRAGAADDIQGPASLAEIAATNAAASNPSNVLIVAARGQSHFALKKAKWMPFSDAQRNG